MTCGILPMPFVRPLVCDFRLWLKLALGQNGLCICTITHYAFYSTHVAFVLIAIGQLIACSCSCYYYREEIYMHMTLTGWQCCGAFLLSSHGLPIANLNSHRYLFT